MGLLDRLERALETLIEGRLMGRFSGQVHPLELARRLAREMQGARRISVRRTYVPNVFRVALSAADLDPLRPIESGVRLEILEYLEETVRAGDFHLSGPLVLEFRPDEGMLSGQIDVSCEFVAGPEGTLEIPAATAVPVKTPPHQVKNAPAPRRKASPKPPPGVRAQLLGRTGFVRGQIFPMQNDSARMGRTPDCDVYVPDAQVSRDHGRFEWTGTTYRLTDTESRNGIRVNGVALEGHRDLLSGDRIEVGSSELRFELGLQPERPEDKPDE